jgi:hypothetical protein
VDGNVAWESGARFCRAPGLSALARLRGLETRQTRFAPKFGQGQAVNIQALCAGYLAGRQLRVLVFFFRQGCSFNEQPTDLLWDDIEAQLIDCAELLTLIKNLS